MSGVVVETKKATGEGGFEVSLEAEEDKQGLKKATGEGGFEVSLEAEEDKQGLKLFYY